MRCQLINHVQTHPHTHAKHVTHTNRLTMFSMLAMLGPGTDACYSSGWQAAHV